MGCYDSKPLPELSARDIERFWSFVDKTPGHGPDGDCWPWTGGMSPGGYGNFWLGGKTVIASRVAYLLHHGQDSYPLLVRHSCDLKVCCNGAHLLNGTQGDNMQDAMDRHRTATGDRNATHLYPERLARGDRNGQRLHPERTARGDKSGRRLHPENYEHLKDEGHWTHQHPEKVARGDENGSRLHPEKLNPQTGDEHWTRRNHGSQSGEKNNGAKLTNEIVNQLRREHKANPHVSQRQLAFKYGIIPMQANDILMYRAWKHLPPV